MDRKIKRQMKEPVAALAPGTPVKLTGEPYAGSLGHVVMIHGQAAQMHVDQGPGEGHEVIAGRGRLIILDPQKEQIA